jgi:hypothetical protein
MLKDNLPNHYIQQFVLFTLAALVTGIAIVYVNNIDFLDRLFQATLMILIVYFYNNKNLVSIFSIILIGRLAEEVLWVADEHDYLFKILVYPFSAWLCYYLRYDKLAYFSLCLLFCTLCAEIYWRTIGYAPLPKLEFLTLGICHDLAVRHFLLKRPLLFNSWWNELKRIPTDKQIYNFEYFLRHPVKLDILIVYNAFSYTIHLLNAAMLWISLNYAVRKTSIFKA